MDYSIVQRVGGASLSGNRQKSGVSVKKTSKFKTNFKSELEQAQQALTELENIVVEKDVKSYFIFKNNPNSDNYNVFYKEITSFDLTPEILYLIESYKNLT